MIRSREDIITLAKEIRERYNADDIEQLAYNLGADIEYVYELNDVRIKEVYFPNINTIAVASGLDYTHKRHLIAHGLGHHMLHRDASIGYITLHEQGLQGSKELASIDRLAKEYEAELFACYLLIDEDKLKRLLNEEWIKDAVDAVALLAYEFNVSRDLINFMINIHFSKYESISIC